MVAVSLTLPGFPGGQLTPETARGVVERDRFETESHKRRGGLVGGGVGVLSNKALGIPNYASRLEQWEEPVGMERSIGMLIFQAV